MADFDKNLNPIIRTDNINRPEPLPLGPVNPLIKPSYGGGNVADLSKGEDVFSKLNRAVQNSNFNDKGIFVTYGELDANRRYKTYNPTIENQEDFAAHGQTKLDQAFNGILKGVNLTATTFAGGFATLYGAGKALISPEGKFSDIWDNEFHRELDKWNKKVDQEYLPNYYTDRETNADWYERDNWLTTNFLFDKLIKNSGFAVGAMLGGNVANTAFLGTGKLIGNLAAKGATLAEASQAFKLFTPLLRNTARSFSAGRNIEAAAILENKLSSIADLTERSTKLAQLARQTSTFTSMNDAVRRTAIALYSSAGEAAFEALHTGNEMRDTLIADYIKQNGTEPIGDDLAAIESQVQQVGKAAFLGNMAILSVTEYAQLPFLMGSSYSSSRRAANSILGETDDVVLREGRYVAAGPTSRAGKIYKGVVNASRYVIDPKEGAQEIGQYAISVGTQNYFDKASKSDEADVWVDGVMYGLFGIDDRGEGVGAFNSKEGMEGGVLGMITGGLMQAKGTYQSSVAKNANTQKFLSMLNNSKNFKEAYLDKLRAVNRGVVLQQEHRDAVLNGDRQEAMDIQSDISFNYLSPRIKYGRFDMIMEDVVDLRQSSMTEEGLAQLKQQGVANINDTVAEFQSKLDRIERDAQNINEIYQSLNLRYAGLTTVDNERLYPLEVIDKMAYAASKIVNYEQRIPELTSQLSQNQIITSDILLGISKNGKASREDIMKAVNAINSLDTTSERKDELKILLEDTIELSMRRKLFMNEYEGIKNNPLNYVRTPEAEREKEVEVSQKEENAEGEKKIKLEVGKTYSLSEPLSLENGKIILAPKIKVNSSTLGGEYEVQLPDGTISFLSPEQFDRYNITDQENQSQEFEDLLNQAIDDVFNYSGNNTLEKPKGNKVEYVNEFGDPKIISQVINRFKKLAEELLKKQAERREAEKRLAKSKEEIAKQQAAIILESSDVPTIPNSGNQRIDTGETGLLKDAADFFVSTTTESEEYNDPAESAPHIIRSRVFLNNAHTFKNREALRVIPFTVNQEESLGLSGIVRTSYKVSEDVYNTPGFQEEIRDIDSGFVGAVFVEQDSKGNLHFVNQEGKKIGKVGQPVDTSQVIFQTMATTDIAYSRENDRYRTSQKEEFIAYSQAWRNRRADMLSSDKINSYSFRISKGIPYEERDSDGKYVRSNVSILVPEKLISEYEGLIKVSTTGSIPYQGKAATVNAGLVVIQHEDLIEILSNNKLGKTKANNIFQTIKALAEEMLAQASQGKTVTINPAYTSYIQNVLYYKEPVGAPKDNQFFINEKTMTMIIGNNSYPISEIASKEIEIVNNLSEAYHAINNKTLTKRFGETFYEFVYDGKNLKPKKWKNYQTYLLSGKDRSVSETPLVTNVARPTEGVPYTHKAKYAVLQNFMNLDVQISKKSVSQNPPPAAPKAVKTPPAPPKSNRITVGEYSLNDGTVNKYTFKAGNIEFTATINDNKDISVTTIDSPITKDTIKSIVENNKPVVDAANAQYKQGNETVEEAVANWAAATISVKLTQLYNSTTSKPKEKAPEPPQAPKVELPSIKDQKADGQTSETKSIDTSKFKRRGDNPVYRRVGVDKSSRITEREIEILKSWHAEKVPNLPYRILENVITTYDNKPAYGVYENGIAKFYKGAIKGTEYHEIFEGIWKEFLSSPEQQAILDEFKNQSGDFIDRETGRRIPYIQATDNQARERIADDFADFRTAKIKARSLPAKIVQFFRDIINFFRSMVSNPSLKDELFDAIEAGKFREYTISTEVIADTEARYARIPGINESQANEFVQDMTIVISSFVFNKDLQNKDQLYNIKELTGNEIYAHVKSIYEEYGQYQELGEDSFNQLYRRSVDFMKTMGVNIDAESQVTINDENASKNEYAADAFSVDWKKASRFAIKFSLSTLPEVTNNKDKFGNYIPKESSIGGYVLSNFSKTFANLLEKLSNTSLAYIDKKLLELIDLDKSYSRVFTRLGGDLSTGTIDTTNFTKNDWRFFIQFYQTFTKQKPDSLIQFIAIDGSAYTASGDQYSEGKRLVRRWFENFKQAARSKDSLLKFNRDRKEYYVDKTSENFPAKVPTKPADMIDFLGKLGIQFSIDNYAKLSDRKGKGQKINDRDKFAENVSSIYTYLKKGDSVFTINGSTLGINGPLNSLASLYIKATVPNQDNTLLNVEGERIQKYADSNATSVLETEFNEAKTLDDLLASRPELNDIYSKNSIVLKRDGKFFNLNGERISSIKVSTIQGSLPENERSGTPTASLTKGKRFTQEINQNLNGNYYILVPADSSTEWMINLGTHISFDFVNTGPGWYEIYEIFNGYLIDEINLAMDYKNRNDLEHTSKKAKELRMFKDILAPNIVEDIESMIAEDKTFAEIEKYISDNQSSINDSIRRSILSNANQTKETLLNTREITASPKENDVVYSFKNLDKDFSERNNLNSKNLTEAQLENILVFSDVNYAIANIELHKILFGDPYQFKTGKGKIDETKRIKSFLSPRRQTFDSVDFNNFLNKNYNNAHNITLDEDDKFFHTFKSYARTVSLSDIELITPLFENVNETDGFSIISIHSYREIKLKNAEWPDEAEAWYQWDNSYARQKLAAKGLYTYTNKALEEKDRAVISTPKPSFKSEVLKPIVSGVKHNKNRIELTLDKFSQMPISYQAVEERGLEELYIKMLNEKIDYGIFGSGRKAGVRSKHSLYKDGKFNKDPFAENTIEDISWKSYGIQVENSYEDKEQTRGSQPTKLSSLDMFDNGEETIPGAKKEYERNVKILDEMHENAYNQFLEKLGIEDLGNSYKLIDPSKISETLEHELLRREASENMKETLRRDENGEFRIPFESSPAYKQIKDIIYSMVNKSLISPKMSGKPHVQVPATLWENSKEGRNLVRKIDNKWVQITRSQYDALSESEKQGVRLTSGTLHFYKDEDGKRYMEVMLPNWFKSKIDTRKYPNDGAILNYLNNSEEGRKILSGIGFRIPTQAMSSIDVIKVKGFLDSSMGSTVVVPSEITSKAGSDFDIDKLNMYLKAVYTDKEGNIRLIEYKGSKEATIKFYEDVYDNTLQAQLDKIESMDEFREKLLEVFDILESVENPDLMENEGLDFLLGDLASFYHAHISIIKNFTEQANERDMYVYDYMVEHMDKISDKADRIVNKMSNNDLRSDYAKLMYKRSLENEYYDSLEKLITLPGNFQRLISPVGTADLDKVAAKLDEIRGESEAGVSNKLINRNFLTSLRHAFLLGKKWVGIGAVNITGHSLAQKSRVYIDPSRFENISEYDRKFLGDGTTFLPHNSIEINGRRLISLSGTKVANGIQYISDRLSGYITAFVDVAKDPYILKIIESDLAVGTVLFMERIGMGEVTTSFITQPIISQYLNYLDSIGSRSIFSNGNITYIESLFPTDEDISSVEIDVNNLLGYTEKYYSGAEPSSMDNAIQRKLFYEFLKMAKMAQYNFKFSQAYNYDTTRFKDADSFERKMVRTETARDENIISSIDNILRNSHIGVQKTFIEKAINSLGAIIKTESNDIKKYIGDIMKPFLEDEFLSADKFGQVASRLKSSFLDFVIFTRSNMGDSYASLLTGDNSVASNLEMIQNKHRNLTLLQNLEVESSDRDGGAATIKLNVQARDAYDQNMYVGMMRELRDVEPDFYRDLVRVAILQGNYNSAISIKSIIPIEDYSEIIKPIIDSLQPHVSLEQFEKDGLFYRNNWRIEDIVPTTTLRMYETEDATFDQYDNELIKYSVPDIAKIKKLEEHGNNFFITLDPTFSFINDADKDFIKVRRYQPMPDGSLVNIFNGQTISPVSLAKRRKAGDLSLYDYIGFMKVKDSTGQPVTNKKGKHIYKAINLYGDGQYAIEYPTSLGPSVFNNGSVKIEQEIPDAEIIKYFGGNPGQQTSLPINPTSINTEVTSSQKDRQIQVEQFKITIKPDGTMFYQNGNEVTDQTTKNKVNIRKELQDGTLRTSVYNKFNYFVLSDDRIVGSGKTNLGKESITSEAIKEQILEKAVLYKKQC